ncbi:hypothetical protein HN51_013707 [Arachis hypogaea]|uniref:Pectate lyase N-terminal domain-containing protein n=1 Tax=Arachis hypogaea TaxID=3818 RepID=A0A445DP58_ARAHY|nr:uncharacterized protein LOC107634790 [Arachis ipaensis]XP_025639008.1 uncharacterized protein LOC112734041 [Arachis hypogaea]QHO59501.1 Pectate lyase [Arachis hypogaea]RYR64921.1 hypothetical protein Ahy_A03g010941 [Arachis hypogaea]
MASKIQVLLPILLLALTCIPTMYANILETDAYIKDITRDFDPYWWQRAEVAKIENQKAYFPDPYAVSSDFTSAITDEIARVTSGQIGASSGKIGAAFAFGPIGARRFLREKSTPTSH